MPTRYSLECELKSVVTADIVAGSNQTAKQNARKEVKKMFEDKYNVSLKTGKNKCCLLYTSPSPRDQRGSRMPSSA